ncbi:predicted protein [Uncinocarpus reesii 1704]|uniref:Uncharacterized protein n=1 Tax=Uncinocarpus reesii (strain UAMH 1704) TaxID=336963 RepID=C4JGF4_UNCRE|nr:uncharacterized protein UREG_01145 [Uncinocarpus reesii 1704]EEP76296.1 predicted protein [Uncinocarpus reesii 1704]
MAALGWSYPSPPPAGFWSPRTSTMNFCELDYIVSTYIAEFINTISNFVYWDYAILLSYIQLAGVGIGSIAFHSTLKFPAQIVDEMAMLYATSTVIYAVFAFRLKPMVQLFFGFLLFAGLSVITILHVQQENSLAHRICFATMIVIVAARCSWLLLGVTDLAIRSEMKHLAFMGTVYSSAKRHAEPKLHRQAFAVLLFSTASDRSPTKTRLRLAEGVIPGKNHDARGLDLLCKPWSRGIATKARGVVKPRTWMLKVEMLDDLNRSVDTSILAVYPDVTSLG